MAHYPGIFEEVYEDTLKELCVSSLAMSKLFDTVDLNQLSEDVQYFYSEIEDTKYAYRNLIKEDPVYYTGKLKDLLQTQYEGLYVLYQIFKAYTHAIDDVLGVLIDEQKDPTKIPS